MLLASARVAACTQARALPPSSSVTAAAAIAALEPISAWHPPALPEMCIFAGDGLTDARGEHERHHQRLVADAEVVGHAEERAPGTVPAEPAVGAATIRRIRAFSSFTAMA